MGWDGSQASQFCQHCGMPISSAKSDSRDNHSHLCQRCKEPGCNHCMDLNNKRGYFHQSCEKPLISTQVWQAYCQALSRLYPEQLVGMEIEVSAKDSNFPLSVRLFPLDEQGNRMPRRLKFFSISGWEPRNARGQFAKLKEAFLQYNQQIRTRRLEGESLSA